MNQWMIGNAEDKRQSYEIRLARTIEDLLERSVGPGNVRAEVSAEMDFDRVTENAEIYEIDDDLLDQIFDFMVRDMSKHALTLSLQPSSTDGQIERCRKMLRKPVEDADRYGRVWKNHVEPLDGAYEMTP